VFSGEAKGLARALRGEVEPPSGSGVSLIAVLRKNHEQASSLIGGDA
jgi:hypothetical protein